MIINNLQLIIGEGKSKSSIILGKNQSVTWSSTAFNYWILHREKICNSCSIIFHHDWDLKIAKNKDFIDNSSNAISNLIQKLEKDGSQFEVDKYCSNLRKEIKNLKKDLILIKLIL